MPVDLANVFDVVVVGGGPAGLSGAVTLARARRSVLVVDAGQPRNAAASEVHGFISREGISPADLIAAGRAEVRRYGGQIIDGRAVSAAQSGGEFLIVLSDGSCVRARRILVTTGVVDQVPDFPGARGRWGRDVLHCPYCHGWEWRDRAIGVVGRMPAAADNALTWAQWSADVTLFTGSAAPDESVSTVLAARGVTVVPGDVAGLVVKDDRLTGVRLADGRVIAREGVVIVEGGSVTRSELLKSLGVPVTQTGQVSHDQHGRTPVPGVWVAGNVADAGAKVVTSAAAGMQAGALISNDLINEDITRSVADELSRRAQADARADARAGVPAA